MASLSFLLALVLSIFYVAYGDAEKDAKKPYTINKSVFCSSDQNNEFCTSDNYNFYNLVEKIVESNDKLSEKKKDVGKNSGKCANALKKAMCSKESPLCFEGNDNSGSERVCGETLATCPYLTKGRCVSYLQSKFKNLTCVGIGEDETFKGYCPKPSEKMPASYWLAYKKKSDILEGPMGILENVNKATGVELVSPDCLQKIKDVVCVPLYCSEDEKMIEVPNMQDKCNAVLKCFNKVFDKYGKLSKAFMPIKEILNDGCDKVVNVVRSSLKSSEATGDAYSISHIKGLGIVLITINILLFL